MGQTMAAVASGTEWSVKGLGMETWFEICLRNKYAITRTRFWQFKSLLLQSL
jgi:hypothetical protein